MKTEFKEVNAIVGDKVVKPRAVLISAEYQNFEQVVVVGGYKVKDGLYLASSHNVSQSIILLEAALRDLKARLT